MILVIMKINNYMLDGKNKKNVIYVRVHLIQIIIYFIIMIVFIQQNNMIIIHLLLVILILLIKNKHQNNKIFFGYYKENMDNMNKIKKNIYWHHLEQDHVLY